MKFLYGVLKKGNHGFATYYTHYKKELGMRELLYDCCLFYNLHLFSIMKIETDDTFIRTINDFASVEENAIKLAKIMTKKEKYLTPTHPLKLNSMQIEFNLNGMVLIKKSYVGKIVFVIDHIINSISSRSLQKSSYLKNST